MNTSSLSSSHIYLHGKNIPATSAPKKKRFSGLRVGVGAVLLFTALSTNAADLFWICSNGQDWNSSPGGLPCWATTPGGAGSIIEPSSGDTVNLTQSGTTDIAVQYSDPFPAVSLTGLVIDGTGSGQMTLSLSDVGSSLTTGYLFLGDPGGGVGSGTLNIGSGTSVTSSTSSDISNGTATVSGLGASWSTGGRLYIGSISSIATLDILNGGVVNSVTGTLAGDPFGGSGGLAIVNVNDSAWLNSGNLYVGGVETGIVGGAGTLNISNGGLVSNASGYIGFGPYPGSWISEVSVDGASSNWTNSGDLYIGESREGTLSINNSGTVDSSSGYLGFNAGANGTATISGSLGNTSSWDNSSALTVGAGGSGILNINDYGSVTNTTGILGAASGSSGTAEISGALAVWTNSGSLTVGGSGTGTLNISSGGTVSNTNGTLGDAEGNGTATISGTGSQWINSGYLTVGDLGAGVLTIDSGGVVSSDSGYIGNSIDGNGAATISGPGSQWVISSDLIVGLDAYGTLIIDSGGIVISSGSLSEIGKFANGDGTATISGAGSQWTNSGSLSVGSGGKGVLNIQSGGAVSNIYGALGKSGDGTATISGAGSQWTISGALDVGEFGTGTLNISSGGTVSNTNGTLGKFGNGTATISGAGSQWALTDDLIVGEDGTGTLNISSGGAIYSTIGFLGSGGGYGMATISGTDSSWNNSSDLFVAGSSTSANGAAELIVANNGLVNVGTLLKVWSGGTVHLNGGTITAGTLDNEGAFNFNAGVINIGGDYTASTIGTNTSLSGLKTLNVGGTTTLDGFTTLSVDGGTFSTGSLIDNGGFSFNSGTFNLTNDSLTIGAGGLFGQLALFSYGQTVNVESTATVNSGSVLSLDNGAFSADTLNNNGSVTLGGAVASLGGGAIGGTLNNSGLLSGNGQVTSTLQNSAGGEVRASSGDSLLFTNGGNINDGQIALQEGTVQFMQSLTNNAGGDITGRGTLIANGGLTNNGNIDLSAGTTDIHGDVNNSTGGSIMISGNATATFFDDVVNNGIEFFVQGGSTAVIFGVASGDTDFTGPGDIYLEGGLAPGNSPGSVYITGDTYLGANSHTLMEIGGLARGTEYDALDVAGELLLAGELEIALYDMGEGIFAPEIGDSFDLFTAENINGNFDILTIFGLAGMEWDLDILTDAYGSTDVLRLTAQASSVPLPTAAWLFISGLGLIIVARRRQVD